MSHHTKVEIGELRVVHAKRRRTLLKRGEHIWWEPNLGAWVWRPVQTVIEAKGFVVTLRGVDLMSMCRDSGPINQEIPPMTGTIEFNLDSADEQLEAFWQEVREAN